jgi:translation initiation factor IF-1
MIPEKPVAQVNAPAYIPRSVSQEPGNLNCGHMPEADAIRLEGTVVAVLKEAKLFRVELINGHQLLGHVPTRRMREAASLKLGDRVNLKMTVCDFSHGQIVLEERQNESPRIS